jgi:ADP-dependent phosphofructokinase/glucokinase
LNLILAILNYSYKTKITFKNVRTRTQVVRSERVCVARRERILIAVQMNTIRILRKIANAQVTVMSGITWGL